MIGVIVGKPREKIYRPVEPSDIEAVDAAKALQITVPTEYIVPEINSPTASPKAGAHRSINLELYGFKRWGQLFSHRQLVLMFSLLNNFTRRPPKSAQNCRVPPTEARSFRISHSG